MNNNSDNCCELENCLAGGDSAEAGILAEFTPDALEAAGALTPTYDPGYIYPSDPAVEENLEHWQDLKLGVIIHWGIYTTIGQAGSWSLHRSHLGDFTDPPEDFRGTDAEYHQWYYEQRHKFCADDFDAEQWASLCGEAGMKYAIVTTKHHDGFALYDTKFSNLKVTAEDVPARRDIFAETSAAFRAHGLETGVYFSKADWASPEYWDLALPLSTRFCNYDIEADPQRWQRFVRFTHGQIKELLENYGPMNVLWLDAGWVRAPEEDIQINEIARIARAAQPGILVVDREVHGEHENYRTPEQELPDRRLDYPWESCITWTKSWCSMRKDEPCKPTWHIVANLLKICARGGNYLIGFGPDATGALSVHLQRGLKELGAYMTSHGEGIYGTRALAEPPHIQQLSGQWHEWLCVSKQEKDNPEHTPRLYLYGIPARGECSPVRIAVAGSYGYARNLGGGQAQIVSSPASTSQESVTTIDIAPAEGQIDMGYVIELR